MQSHLLRRIGVVAVLTLVAGCASGPHPGPTEGPARLGLDAASPSLELLAPGHISTALDERDFAQSPDGRQVVFTVRSQGDGTLVRFVRDSGGWRGPEVVAFSGVHSDFEPFFAPDGGRLYFASNRPREPNTEAADYDLWYVPVSGLDFGAPVNLGPPVNTPANEFYPSLTRSGTLYFTAVYDGGPGQDDLYRARPTADGGFQAPEVLPEPVNSPALEFNAFVDPDERFIIFTVFGREEDAGGGDLVISRPIADGWSAPVSLGPKVNSKSLDFCPYVTPDGKRLVFTSRRPRSVPGPRTYRSLVKAAEAPGNGLGDLYSIAIDELRADAFRDL
jgi:hypothetical protein